MNVDAVIGCLLGLAVGDALGLPREKLSRRRGDRIFPDADQRHRFYRGRGLFSDDTEHACLTAQAMLRSGGQPELFQRELARRLRWWAAAIPAGIGRATLASCCKLWLGYSPQSSGVFSAGNAPAIRAPLLGICLGDDLEKLGAFLQASTRLTHTHPAAEYGAFAIAWAARTSAMIPAEERVEPRPFVEELRQVVRGDIFSSRLFDRLDAMVLSLEMGQSTEEFANTMEWDRGVGGYVLETVPVALHAWQRHPTNFREAVGSVIRCGGDTDTTAAIVGALVGSRVGKAGIPSDWIEGIIDWPRSVTWVEELGRELARGEWRATPQKAKPLAVWAIPLRNAFFLACVLKHGLRRLLPPY